MRRCAGLLRRSVAGAVTGVTVAAAGAAGGYTIGQMPAYEGLLLSYGPAGNVTWSHRYPTPWFMFE
jgi:hypothetical protein